MLKHHAGNRDGVHSGAIGFPLPFFEYMSDDVEIGFHMEVTLCYIIQLLHDVTESYGNPCNLV